MNFKFKVTSGKQLLMQSLKNLALKIWQYTEKKHLTVHWKPRLTYNQLPESQRYTMVCKKDEVEVGKLISGPPSVLAHGAWVVPPRTTSPTILLSALNQYPKAQGYKPSPHKSKVLPKSWNSFLSNACMANPIPLSVWLTVKMMM